MTILEFLFKNYPHNSFPKRLYVAWWASSLLPVFVALFHLHLHPRLRICSLIVSFALISIVRMDIGDLSGHVYELSDLAGWKDFGGQIQMRRDF